MARVNCKVDQTLSKVLLNKNMRSVEYVRESSKVNAWLYQVGRSIPHSQVKDEKSLARGRDCEWQVYIAHVIQP